MDRRLLGGAGGLGRRGGPRLPRGGRRARDPVGGDRPPLLQPGDRPRGDRARERGGDRRDPARLGGRRHRDVPAPVAAPLPAGGLRGAAARARPRAIRRPGPRGARRQPASSRPARASSAWSASPRRPPTSGPSSCSACTGSTRALAPAPDRQARLARVRRPGERRDRGGARDVHRPGRGGLARHGRPGPRRDGDDYEPDAALCAAIVADGLERGATSFLADIELPSPELDTPAYEYFARLGFRRPYVRTHWTRL